MSLEHLNVYVSTKIKNPSFNPLDSDGIINAIHLEQVVGTLVRMSPSGRYEGYLAQSWSTSEDSTVWTFELRPNLKDGDGKPLDAKTYIEGLNKVLLLLSDYSALPIVEDIVGFQNFKKLKKISGIRQLHNQIQFQFNKPIRSGFLEYLALPYLGYYASGNFKDDGSWRDDNFVVSSASYQIISSDKDLGRTELGLRDFPFRGGKHRSYKRVSIILGEVDYANVAHNNSFIINFSQEKSPANNKFNILNLMPTILNAVILSDSRNTWLKEKKHRAALRSKIKEIQKQEELPLVSAKVINTIYPHQSSKSYESEPVESLEHFTPPTSPLVVRIPESPSSSTKYMLKILEKALKALQIDYAIESTSNDQRNLMDSFRDHMKFDIKPINVDSGGGIENQLIKFMFCSKLGVSFPDPSKRICKLVQKYEDSYGDSIPKEILINYTKEFDEILFDDAAVIPMIKTAHTWLISKNIDLKCVSPTMGIPYFDLLVENED